MATKAGTLELIARELGIALAPLEQRLQGGGAVELLAAVGVRVPASVASHAQVVGAIGSAVTSAAALAPDLAALVAAIDADDEAQILSHGIAVITGAGNVISALKDLGQALDTATGAASLTPAEKATLQAALIGIPRRLFDFVVIEYIESKSIPAVEALTLLGIVDKVFVPGDPTNPMVASFVRRELRIDRLSDLLTNPVEYLKATYKFGAPDFDGRALFVRIHEFLDEYDYPVVLIEPPGQPPILEAYLLSMEPLLTNPPSLGLKFRFKATQDFEREFEVADPWSFRLGVKARFDAGMDGTITPPLNVSLTPPSSGASLELNADMVAEDGGTPMVMLGEAGGSRLEATKFSAGFGFKAKAEGGALKAEPVVRAEVKGGRLVIDMSKGDGFINTILSGIRVESKFELATQWTPSDGIRFEGGADLELVVPLNLNLGPVEIQTLYFLLGFAPDPPINIGVAAAIGVQIGPFGMSVDKIGLDVPIRFPPNRDGNLGAADLAFAFKPPTGIGVVVDAGPISGGGFLSIDVPNGRYAGILQLETPLVSVTAIGLLDTKLPGGVQGFSFLILVSVELPPIQLGFGFTFNGVGGMAGIHRTVAVDVMRQSVRTGGLNSIMFPRDPVRNAPQIIADLRAFFPPAQNRFIFGPFIKVGWGTPSLITGNLGVILELPDPVRILILGQLKVALPVPELPLVSLNLDVLGVIDFGEAMLSIDASLYDSRVTIYSVYGDMALRLSWGARPIFALSIGGLHPQFKPPPNFPSLRRCTIEIGVGTNPRLACMSYFALTANSVQFGARIEAYAKAAGFTIHGWLGFDAIVIFVPFSFRVDISGGVELKRGNSVIAGIHLNASLQGPNPWHAEGRACLSLFFFDICVPFSITIGQEQGQPVPTINAWDRLQEALREVRNWQSELPKGARKTIGYAVPAGSALTLVEPAGGLAVQQKVLPLNKPLEKLGEARIEGDARFDVSHVRVGGQNEAHTPETDFFAAGQYQNLSDAEKLSRDSYELMDAGVAIAGAAVTNGDIRETPLVYETIVIDAPDPGAVGFRDFLVRRLGDVVLTQAEFSRMADRAAHELHPRKGMERFAPAPGEPPRMKVEEELYVVASTNTLQIHGSLTRVMTKGAAHDALRELVKSNPAEAGQWQVLSKHEAEAA